MISKSLVPARIVDQTTVPRDHVRARQGAQGDGPDPRVVRRLRRISLIRLRPAARPASTDLPVADLDIGDGSVVMAPSSFSIFIASITTDRLARMRLLPGFDEDADHLPDIEATNPLRPPSVGCPVVGFSAPTASGHRGTLSPARGPDMGPRTGRNVVPG